MSKSRARKFADMFRSSLATVLEGNDLAKDDVTGLTEIETKAAENEQAISALHAVSTSGDYNDLINKPSLDHADTSSQVSVNNSGSTVIQDITLDEYGHITGINSTTISSGGIKRIAGATGTPNWNKTGSSAGSFSTTRKWVMHYTLRATTTKPSLTMSKAYIGTKNGGSISAGSGTITASSNTYTSGIIFGQGNVSKTKGPYSQDHIKLWYID